MIEKLKTFLYQFSIGVTFGFFLIFLSISTYICTLYGLEGLVILGLIFEKGQHSVQLFAILFIFGVITTFIDKQVFKNLEKKIWNIFIVISFLCISIIFIAEILHHYDIITTRFRIM